MLTVSHLTGFNSGGGSGSGGPFKFTTYARSTSNQVFAQLGFKPEFLVGYNRSFSGAKVSTITSSDELSSGNEYYWTANERFQGNQIGAINNNLTGFKATGLSFNNQDASAATQYLYAWKQQDSYLKSLSANSDSVTPITHGFGAKPDMIFAYCTDGTDNPATCIYHSAANVTNRVYSDLNTDTTSFTSVGSSSFIFNTTNTHNYFVMFGAVSGLSKFGTYSGNHSSTATTGFGFKPTAMLIKDYTGSNNEGWAFLQDTTGSGTVEAYFPNNQGQTTNPSGWYFDSDGFTRGVSTVLNSNSTTYLYAAWA